MTTTQITPAQLRSVVSAWREAFDAKPFSPSGLDLARLMFQVLGVTPESDAQLDWAGDTIHDLRMQGIYLSQVARGAIAWEITGETR